MAVVTTKATVVSNREATPAVLTDARIGGARMIEAVGHVSAASGDSSGSKYLMAEVPSNAGASQVLLSCDGDATTGAADIGIFELDGSDKDVDLFASAQDLTSALTNSDVTHESGEYDISEVEKPLWELLGESEDPNKIYLVGLKLTTGLDSADDIALRVRYVR